MLSHTQVEAHTHWKGHFTAQLRLRRDLKPYDELLKVPQRKKEGEERNHSVLGMFLLCQTLVFTHVKG